ncbi:tetratricopeptide repeat protein [Catenuloplanes atrovinosus]|uniref:Fibronectin type-III domain-containing protein n=1 Tax=Catenuloplanes atrovinosus TaxID=137266 RepID=A0AAE4C9N2_9ACTN|nr:tetratricopeptide repeat protein [Catenuloplanes atrovinosus]MDR7273765.1 hypothetical protein [Catenuloplanes atrovinosus]
MSHGLAELTAHAKDLVGAGDLGSAQALLSDALAAVDVDPLRASADLADAAGLLARILVALGEPHSARAWATFAHTAQRRLRGPADEHTVVAAATLAAVLHRVGAYAGAAHLYRDVVARLTLVDGPGSTRVLAAQADLATVEHARGECETARRLLADAYRRHRETYGEGHPAGIKMLARLGTMERDCGNFGEAHQRFSGARDLCREYLPADHPMAAQIAALARAGADPDHVCRNLHPADDDISADPPDLPIPTGTTDAPSTPDGGSPTATTPGAADAPGGTAGTPWGTAPQRSPRPVAPAAESTTPPPPPAPWADPAPPTGAAGPPPAPRADPAPPTEAAGPPPAPRADPAPPTEAAGPPPAPWADPAPAYPSLTADAGFDDFPPDVDDLSAPDIDWPPRGTHGAAPHHDTPDPDPAVDPDHDHHGPSDASIDREPVAPELIHDPPPAAQPRDTPAPESGVPNVAATPEPVIGQTAVADPSQRREDDEPDEIGADDMRPGASPARSLSDVEERPGADGPAERAAPRQNPPEQDLATPPAEAATTAPEAAWHPPMHDLGAASSVDDREPVIGPWHPPLQTGDDVEPWRAVSFYVGPRPGEDDTPARPPADEPAAPAGRRAPQDTAAAWRPTADPDRPEAWQPPAERGPSEPWPRGSDSGATPWTPPERTPPPTPRWPASGIPKSTPWVAGAAAHPAPVPTPPPAGTAPEEEPFGDWPLDQPPAWQPPDPTGAWSSAPPATPDQGDQPAAVPPQSRQGRFATPPTPVPYDDRPDEQRWTDDGAAAPLPPAVFDDLSTHGPHQAAPPAVAQPRQPAEQQPQQQRPPAEDRVPRGYAQRQARQDQPWRSQARGVRTPPPGGRYSPLAPGYGQPGQPQIKAHRRTQGDRSLTAGPAARRQPPGMLVPTRRPAGLAPERYPERPTGKIIAALVAVGLGTIVVIGGFLLTERDTRQPAPPQPTASAGAPSDVATPPPAQAPVRAAAGPPTGVRIQDSRTQVTLTWAYPDDAEGPVLIAGGRRGNSVPIKELPAGTEQYPVYNLNPDADYCFTVAVVYSTSAVEKSPEVCTSR